MLLAESAEALIREAAVHAHPHETGGILVGVWTEGRPWVTHACEVASAESGPTRYVLPAGATRIRVDRMQRADSRLGYLGDWHTHPMDAAASGVDRQTVRKLTRSSGLEAGEVVLLVARRRGQDHVIEAHLANPAWVRNVSIVRTGDLGEA